MRVGKDVRDEWMCLGSECLGYRVDRGHVRCKDCRQAVPTPFKDTDLVPAHEAPFIAFEEDNS